MNHVSLITRLRWLSYSLRRGRPEQALAFLTLSLLSLTIWLHQEWKDMLAVSYVSAALAIICLGWLVFRINKQAAPPPLSGETNLANAVKGLVPFSLPDGELFARLGRRPELRSLLGLATDNQISVVAVRGESGVGKTSLLQAGLAYALAEAPPIYWEATSSNAPENLLYAISHRIPEVKSLESLPEGLSERSILILDQFEQLKRDNPKHSPIFSLIERIVRSPRPHRITVIVSFRRDYTADWFDFEQSLDFRAEPVVVKRFPTQTATDTLVVLVTEAGFSVDNTLVENLIGELAQSDGVSPTDIAIAVLSLANLAEQSNRSHLGKTEYDLAGGGEGLLLRFVQRQLEEIPDPIRGSLLAGFVLTLVDLSTNQRVAEGATAAEIAAKADASVSSLIPWLTRFSHPRVRILEKLPTSRYRLQHERLVPVLRRLSGTALQFADQVRLNFEIEFARWRQTNSRRYLMSGKDLHNVIRNSDTLIEGDVSKINYILLCRRQRSFRRLFLSLSAIVAFFAFYGIQHVWEYTILREDLASWRLPLALITAQRKIDGLEINNHLPTNLDWIAPSNLRILNIGYTGSGLKGISNLHKLESLELRLIYPTTVLSLDGLGSVKNLQHLSLDVVEARSVSFRELQQLPQLTKLSIGMDESAVASLPDLWKLNHLRELALYVDDISESERIQALPRRTSPLRSIESSRLLMSGISTLSELSLLDLNLPVYADWLLPNLQELHNLRSLHVALDSRGLNGLCGLRSLTSLRITTGVDVKDLRGLECLTTLNELTLDLRASDVTSLEGLNKLSELTSLNITLDSGIMSLASLLQLPKLRSLEINFYDSRITSISDLGRMKHLSSLGLGLGKFRMEGLASLRRVSSLRSLSIFGMDFPPDELADLGALTQIRSLSMFLPKGSGDSIAWIGPLNRLTSLTLFLFDSDLSSLVGLRDFKELTTMKLVVGKKFISLDGIQQLSALRSFSLSALESPLSSLEPLAGLHELKDFRLTVQKSQIRDVSSVGQMVGLRHLSLDLWDSDVTDISGLARLSSLESAELFIPASLLSNGAADLTRRDVTKLWIIFEGPNLPEVPRGYRFVGLSDTQVVKEEDER